MVKLRLFEAIDVVEEQMHIKASTFFQDAQLSRE